MFISSWFSRAIYDTSLIIVWLDIWGYAASVFHLKHSVYASDSAKTSWGKREWVFFCFFDFSWFLWENIHFPRGSAIRGKKCAHQGRIIDSRDQAYNVITTGETSAEMISGSVLWFWCNRFNSRGLFYFYFIFDTKLVKELLTDKTRWLW
jgi:hypothetical protein